MRSIRDRDTAIRSRRENEIDPLPFYLWSMLGLEACGGIGDMDTLEACARRTRVFRAEFCHLFCVKNDKMKTQIAALFRAACQDNLVLTMEGLLSTWFCSS